MNKNKGYMKTNTQILSYLAHLFLEWEMFQTEVVLVDEIKTHFLCSVTLFFFENRVVYEKMWKKL
jgi:hypothetical protein